MVAVCEVSSKSVLVLSLPTVGYKVFVLLATHEYIPD